MDSSKVKQFMSLAGQKLPPNFETSTPEMRKLGAQLLLSEVLEYVVSGLGVIPEFNGTAITDPNGLNYNSAKVDPDRLEMLDGLADVAYTMYWNALAFGIPLERAYELVCDNNLEKFVALPWWEGAIRDLERDQWGCHSDVTWPPEVVRVEVIEYQGKYFAVGKDKNGKVRKPSNFEPVALEALL